MFSQSVRPNVISQARSLYGQMNAVATPNNYYAEEDRKKTRIGDFPMKLGSAQPDDLEMAARQNLTEDSGIVKGFGMAVADDRVFNYLERKKEAEIEADYRAWVASQADFSDPAQAEFWNKVAPWITDLKLQEIDQNLELQKRLATLQVKGPTSEEDFKLMYMIANGMVRVPTQPAQMMDKDTGRYPGVKTLDFKRGLFNPLAITPPKEGFPKPLNNRPSSWAQPFDLSEGIGQNKNTDQVWKDLLQGTWTRVGGARTQGTAQAT